MQSKNIFLTLEGIEGVGKSTAMSFIQTYLTHAKKDFVVTREPGGTPIAEQIRQLLLTPSQEVMIPETELLLMFASRVQHIHSVISPALKAGKWVLSDRFVDASYAYQGGGRNIDFKYIEMLEHWLVQDIQPDITLLLDAPPEIGLMRAKHRSAHDRIEQEKRDFFERVRAAYLERARTEPKRFHIIDATLSIEAVEQHIKAILEQYI
jgi:dTMP kinase